MTRLHNPVSSVVIITPTTGKSTLKDVITSVQSQDYPDLKHYIFCDGEQYRSAVDSIVSKQSTAQVCYLPDNTGSDGFNGHRIYAAASYLVNEDIIMYLDEDNFIEPNHVSSLVNLINTKGLDWVYSLRKIHDEDGTFLINDDCESLGRWPSFSGRPGLVDTNCYAIRRSVITQVGHAWYYPRGADRMLFKQLQNLSDNFDSTGLYTVNYRIRSGMKTDHHFFSKGNQCMYEKYGSPLPWQVPFLKQPVAEPDQWSIDNALLNALQDRLFQGASILEFGSGEGTTSLLKHFKVTSIEHDPAYVINRGDGHACYMAALDNGWYDRKVVSKCLSASRYHLLLIDGPPGNNRVNLMDHFDLFKDFDGEVIFDDINRDQDYLLCETFCRELNYSFEIVKGANKHFAWCHKGT